ncbi:hypothetical protein AQUCO_01400243v1 [Aquilegia coerulea]|uniref:DUF632 domain-containing protein n=1 Tax=Aquilegia coerulea TaxID=218851 RepID=A0A2G5DVD7_AQUCA|nr:hypothetical protein AQUCO_01400243v1 [Aquilegia coerulea]
MRRKIIRLINLMGCGGSKVDDLPLVTLCRERKQLIKAASDHRYALAASHMVYFQSLKDVGEALRKFVDEELVIGNGSDVNGGSDSPVLTLPSDEGKKKKKSGNSNGNGNGSSSSTSLTHSVSVSHHHHSPDEDSHLHFESSSQDDSSSISEGHIHGSPDHIHDNSSDMPEPNFSPSRVNTYSYYMRKSSTAIPSVIYEDPGMLPRTAQWGDSSYSSYPQYGGMGGYFGVPMSSGSPSHPYFDPYRNVYNNQPQPSAVTPSPPPPPQISTWDFLNPFESIEDTYSSYYPGGRYGFGSISSSPDSVEVRQREGIPDLEDDTEQEVMKDVRKEKQKVKENVRGDSGEGTSRSVPLRNEDNSKPTEENEMKSSSNESIVSIRTSEEETSTKKGVSSEGDGQAVHDGMLEVGRLPYQPRSASVKVIISRIQSMVSLSTLSSSRFLSSQSPHAMLSLRKMAKVRYEDYGDFRMKSGNLSSTLARLYAWERKLYKEVKDEERLRIIYEKQCKRLKMLDAKGAESSKIDATNASIRKLLAKINVSIKTVDGIARNIHKLRDEVLQPQITELINGLIRMWKSMLKCHQKQFQAMIESKTHNLMANVGSGRGSSLRATVELELELMNWYTHFMNWINTQKAYVESLNEWLMRCLQKESEVTPDGIVPFSPSRVGAPPIFIICNDWYNAMERLSETKVANTMHAFALSLHQLWERQDEEQNQRLKAEYLVKDFEKRLRTLRKEQVKMQRDRDATSEKSAISVVPSESGISPLDDLKVDLDSMRQRLEEEKAKHKATVKQVHEAASSSLQAGLLPIFEALGKFTSDTVKEYEHVRIQNAEASEAS